MPNPSGVICLGVAGTPNLRLQRTAHCRLRRPWSAAEPPRYANQNRSAVTKKPMKIFISYASENRQIAEQVHLALTGADHDTFFDQSNLPVGKNYHERIRCAVEASDMFVFLASPESTSKGSYALTELKYAKNKWRHPSGHVVPVRIGNVSWEDIPEYLKSVTVLEPEGNIAAEILLAVSENSQGGSSAENAKEPQVALKDGEKGIKLIKLAVILGLLGGIAAGAWYMFALTAPPKEHVFKDKQLTNDTNWNYPKDLVRIAGTITTKGHPLSIKAKKVLSEDGVIISGLTELKATQGKDGSKGNDGSSGTGSGQAGKHGENGSEGAKGSDGLSSGPINIDTGDFVGSLSIDVSGQDGGKGGSGGVGGNGGQGAKGEASRPGIVDCSSGPGHGGTGGNGGGGGNGGDGGAGGDGAKITFKIDHLFQGLISMYTVGGTGGEGGKPGLGGKAGNGGAEGDARGSCQPAGRNGSVGDVGTNGNVGRKGENGANGKIVIDLPTIATEATREYKYEQR